MAESGQEAIKSRGRDPVSRQDPLFSVVYEELRAIAHARLQQHQRFPDLHTTALVHEAWLKLSGEDGRPIKVSSQAHFYTTAALAMRQIITDMARRRGAAKRGGKYHDLTLDEEHLSGPDRAGELIALDDALHRLEDLDPRLADVVNLKFFAGFSLDEIADLRQTSRRTISRDWQKAIAYLRAAM